MPPVGSIAIVITQYYWQQCVAKELTEPDFATIPAELVKHISGEVHHSIVARNAFLPFVTLLCLERHGGDRPGT